MVIPLAAGDLTLDEFLRAHHVHVTVTQHDVRFVDNVLAERSLRRKITLTIPHWLALPVILTETDLISVVSERLAC